MKLIPLAFLLLSSAISSATYAASMGVWPINPRIDAPASSTLVWVKNNNNSEPVVLQARIFAWHQDPYHSEDLYEAQDDLVVSPPLIEVKPGAQQIFRVMNRHGVVENVARESSYRLLIDEVPKEGGNEGSLLRFQMRYSLPLFVGLPENYAGQPLSTALKNLETGMRYRVTQEPTAFIEVINRSPVHARLSNVITKNNQMNKSYDLRTGLLGYVLPNSTKRWPLEKEEMDLLLEKNTVVIFEQEHQELAIAAEE